MLEVQKLYFKEDCIRTTLMPASYIASKMTLSYVCTFSTAILNMFGQ